MIFHMRLVGQRTGQGAKGMPGGRLTTWSVVLGWISVIAVDGRMK